MTCGPKVFFVGPQVADGQPSHGMHTMIVTGVGGVAQPLTSGDFRLSASPRTRRPLRHTSTATPLPCRCHDIAMSLPCHCHVIAMPLPCHCHATPMSLPTPCHCHGIAVPLPCHCHVIGAILGPSREPTPFSTRPWKNTPFGHSPHSDHCSLLTRRCSTGG